VIYVCNRLQGRQNSEKDITKLKIFKIKRKCPKSNKQASKQENQGRRTLTADCLVCVVFPAQENDNYNNYDQTQPCMLLEKEHHRSNATSEPNKKGWQFFLFLYLINFKEGMSTECALNGT